DLAGRDVLVHRVGGAQLDMADDGDDEFGANVCRLVVRRAGLGGDDCLRNATAVAQIEEDDVAQIAPLVHPSHEHNFGAGVAGAQLAAHMSTFQVTKKIEHDRPYEISAECDCRKARKVDLRSFPRPSRVEWHGATACGKAVPHCGTANLSPALQRWVIRVRRPECRRHGTGNFVSAVPTGLRFPYNFVPALKRWAKIFRACGAGPAATGRILQIMRARHTQPSLVSR